MEIGIPPVVVPLVALTGFSPQHAMPAPIRNPAELLDIDMHQFPGRRHLVAHRCGRSHRCARCPIQLAQPGHLVSSQHPVHRRRWHPQLPGNAMRTPLLLRAQIEDLLFAVGSSPGR